MIRIGETRAIESGSEDRRSYSYLAIPFHDFRQAFRRIVERFYQESDGAVSEYDVERVALTELVSAILRERTPLYRIKAYSRIGDGSILVALVAIPAQRRPRVYMDEARPNSEETVQLQYNPDGTLSHEVRTRRNPLLHLSEALTVDRQTGETMSQTERQRRIAEENALVAGTEEGLVRVSVSLRGKNGLRNVVLKAGLGYTTLRVNDGKALRLQLRRAYGRGTPIMVEVLPLKAGQVAWVAYSGICDGTKMDFFVPLERKADKPLSDEDIQQMLAPAKRKSREDIF